MHLTTSTHGPMRRATHMPHFDIQKFYQFWLGLATQLHEVGIASMRCEVLLSPYVPCVGLNNPLWTSWARIFRFIIFLVGNAELSPRDCTNRPSSDVQRAHTYGRYLIPMPFWYPSFAPLGLWGKLGLAWVGWHSVILGTFRITS